MSRQSDTELDQILEQIFQGANSLPNDEALERAVELQEQHSQDFDPLAVLINTIARIVLRLDRIESALNNLRDVICPPQVLSPPQVPPGDNPTPSPY